MKADDLLIKVSVKTDVGVLALLKKQRDHFIVESVLMGASEFCSHEELKQEVETLKAEGDAELDRYLKSKENEHA